MTDSSAIEQKDRRTPLALIVVAGVVSIVHISNFLNYSSVGDLVDFAIIRPAILVVAVLCLLPGSIRHIVRYHLRFNAGIYFFCAICMLTTVLSRDPADTLKYSIWLTLSVFLVLELARRVESLDDLLYVLFIVIAPVLMISAAFNIVFGPQVIATGRVFGALGTVHTDAALSLDFILLFLAARFVRDRAQQFPKMLRYLFVFLFVYACVFALVSLTRSVWLASFIGGVIYVLMASNVSEKSILGVFAGIAMLSVLTLLVDYRSFVPSAVLDRVAVTEERVDTGRIDPRIAGIKKGFELSLEHPQGTGYAGGNKTHNTYMDLLVYVGYPGMLVFFIVLTRSALIVYRAGRLYIGFFAIGALGLLMQAFFETQATAGQLNFLPLILWYALTRSPLILSQARISRQKAAAPVPVHSNVLS